MLERRAHGIADAAGSSSLLGHQLLTQHLLSKHLGLSGAIARGKDEPEGTTKGKSNRDSHELIMRTPPFRPLSKVPFPRPPARTWALITRSSVAAEKPKNPGGLVSKEAGKESRVSKSQTELLSHSLSLLGGVGNASLGHIDTILPEKIHAVVLVEGEVAHSLGSGNHQRRQHDPGLL